VSDAPGLVVVWVVAASTRVGPALEAPAFEGRSGPLPAPVEERVRSATWREGCPVPLEDLAYLRLSHWGLDGRVHLGEMIVHADLAAEVVEIFQRLYDARFPIEKMHLAADYAGSDDASMEDDNTSSFNCRSVTGRPGVFSRHSYGRAIDVNPRANPYVRGEAIEPPSGADYADRTRTEPGMVRQGDACYSAFESRGWEWGGDWRSLKDYQHFEKP